MALDTNATKLASLINPQVLADMIDKKLLDDVKFAPLCVVDNTLVARPGNTITLPFYKSIGVASDVTEGADMGIAKLMEDSTTATVKKVGLAIQITDEAILSAYGRPVDEAVRQLRMAIAGKLDNDVLGVLEAIDPSGSYYYSTTNTSFAADDIADALVKFGEDIDGEKVLLISPETYAVLRKADDWCPASEIAANLIIKGAVGMIHGCQVVISNKLKTKKEAFIVKPNALRVFMKRDTMVETDRDILNGSNVIAANKHYVAYLYDESRAIMMKHA